MMLTALLCNRLHPGRLSARAHWHACFIPFVLSCGAPSTFFPSGLPGLQLRLRWPRRALACNKIEIGHQPDHSLYLSFACSTASPALDAEALAFLSRICGVESPRLPAAVCL